MKQTLMPRMILCMALSTLGAGCRSIIVSSAPHIQTQRATLSPAPLLPTVQKVSLGDNQYQLTVMVLQQLQQDLGGKPLTNSSLSRDQLILSPELLSLVQILNTQHNGVEAANVTTVAQLAQYLHHRLPMHDQVTRLRAMIQQYQSSIRLLFA